LIAAAGAFIPDHAIPCSTLDNWCVVAILFVAVSRQAWLTNIHLDLTIRLIDSSKAFKSIDVSIGGKDINTHWEVHDVGGVSGRKTTFIAAR
jgi:hypothetical protein